MGQQENVKVHMWSPHSLPPYSTASHGASSFTSVGPDSFETPWTVSHPAPLSMGFSRQEYWSRLPFPPPGDLSDPRMEPTSLVSPALAGGVLTTSSTWEGCFHIATDWNTLSLSVKDKLENLQRIRELSKGMWGEQYTGFLKKLGEDGSQKFRGRGGPRRSLGNYHY